MALQPWTDDEIRDMDKMGALALLARENFPITHLRWKATLDATRARVTEMDCDLQNAVNDAFMARVEAARWRECAEELRPHVEHDLDCMGDAVAIGPAGVEAILERGGDPTKMPQPCTCGLGSALARFAEMNPPVDAMRKEAGDVVR